MTDNYEYTENDLKPITLEEVKEAIIDSLNNFDGLDVSKPEAQAKIDNLAKEILYQFWENLSYMDEDSRLEDLADELYDE